MSTVMTIDDLTLTPEEGREAIRLCQTGKVKALLKKGAMVAVTFSYGSGVGRSAALRVFLPSTDELLMFDITDYKAW